MKKVFALLLILCLTISMAACVTNETSGTKSTSGTTKSDETTSGASEKELWGKGFKIGVAAAHYTNAWNVTNTQDIVAAFEAIGAEVVWNEGNNDTATQIANVEDLLAQDIDLLVIKPKEEEGLIPAFEQCQKAGVPIICVDRKVRDTSLYVTAIMTDNVAGGEMVGKWIMENFPDGAKIVEITGTPGSTGQIERSQGLANIIGGNSKYPIIANQSADNMRSKAQTVTENLIQTYGKDGIDIIVTQNDEMAMGILQALDGLGIEPGKDIVVCSVGDANREGVSEVAAGRIGCIYESTPYLGAQAVEIAYKVLVSKESVEKYIPSNNRFITIENAEEELKNITW